MKESFSKATQNLRGMYKTTKRRLHEIVTGNETLLHFYEPERKLGNRYDSLNRVNYLQLLNAGKQQIIF